MICEQMGQEPDPAKFPIEMGDMPHVFLIAFTIFRTLPDIYVSLGMEGSALSGKDLSALKPLLDIYEVTDSRTTQLILDIVMYLNDKAVKKAAAERKQRAKKTK